MRKDGLPRSNLITVFLGAFTNSSDLTRAATRLLALIETLLRQRPRAARPSSRVAEKPRHQILSYLAGGDNATAGGGQLLFFEDTHGQPFLDRDQYRCRWAGSVAL